MADVAEKIARLKIELCDIDPPIWRRVDVSADLSLRRIHDVIQAVFDWQGYHLHQFEIGDRLYGATESAEGGLDGRRLYSDKNARLSKLLDRGEQAFLYRYDFGDDWAHLIRVEEVLDPAEGVRYPVLVDGARRAPPEDCGGPMASSTSATSCWTLPMRSMTS